MPGGKRTTIISSTSACRNWDRIRSPRCRASTGRRSRNSAWRRSRRSACCRGARPRSSATCGVPSRDSPGTWPTRRPIRCCFRRRRRTTSRTPISRCTRTNNYDGQLTQQNGIHSRFETALFDRFASRLTVTPGPVSAITNPRDTAFDVLLASYQLVDQLLKADKDAIAGKDSYDDEYFERFFARGPPDPREAAGGFGDGDRIADRRRLGTGRETGAPRRDAAHGTAGAHAEAGVSASRRRCQQSPGPMNYPWSLIEAARHR